MTKLNAAGLVGLALLMLAGCSEGGKGSGRFATLPRADERTTFEKSDAKINSMESGLKYQDIKVGTGAEAETGKHIYVHYSGYLTDGTQFDSSVKHGRPFDLTLGSHQVIKGWDLGIVGMKVGGKRKLMIPSELAYGARPPGGVIPPNADLIFDVELLKVD